MGDTNQDKGALTYTDFSDKSGTNELEGQSLRGALASDLYGKSLVFQVVVLTDPLPMSTEALVKLMDQGDIQTLNTTPNIGLWCFRGRIKNFHNQRPSPHLWLRSPCDISTATGKDAAIAAQLINLHTLFISRESMVGVPPKLGDTVSVELRASDFGMDLQYAFYDEIVTSSNSGASKPGRCTSTLKAYNAATGQNLGNIGSGLLAGSSAKIRSDIQALKDISTPVSAGKQVVSQMPVGVQNTIVSIVSAENSRWNGTPGLKEDNAADIGKSSPEYKILEAYWKATAPDWGDKEIEHNMLYAQKAYTKVCHWSGIYISYVFYKAFQVKAPAKNPDFASSSAHIYYMKHPKWKIYDAQPASQEGKIKAQVGDVLVTVYNGVNRPVVNAHGDVVWMIDTAQKVALLSGGNVGQTVTISRAVRIDDDGNYVTTPAGMQSPRVSFPYYSIMKYNPTEVSFSPSGP